MLQSSGNVVRADSGLEVILINLNANSPGWLVELLQLGRKRPRLTLISFLPSYISQAGGKGGCVQANDTQETDREIFQLGLQGKWSGEVVGLEDCKLVKGLPLEAGREREHEQSCRNVFLACTWPDTSLGHSQGTTQLLDSLD